MEEGLPSVGILPVAKEVYSNYAFTNWGDNHRISLKANYMADGSELKVH